MDKLEETLAHFGIKGMRWGVRKDNTGGTSSAPRKKPGPSVDAARADKIGRKVKTGGVASLSNAELKQLNERMNLEQNYSNLSGKNVNPIGAKFKAEGGLFAKNVLLGVAAQQTKDVLNQRSAQFLIKQGIKAAKG